MGVLSVVDFVKADEFTFSIPRSTLETLSMDYKWRCLTLCVNVGRVGHFKSNQKYELIWITSVSFFATIAKHSPLYIIR